MADHGRYPEDPGLIDLIVEDLDTGDRYTPAQRQCYLHELAERVVGIDAQMTSDPHREFVRPGPVEHEYWPTPAGDAARVLVEMLNIVGVTAITGRQRSKTRHEPDRAPGAGR